MKKSISAVVSDIITKVNKPAKILFVIAGVIIVFGSLLGGAIPSYMNPNATVGISSAYFHMAAGWAFMFALPFFFLAVVEVFLSFFKPEATIAASERFRKGFNNVN